MLAVCKSYQIHNSYSLSNNENYYFRTPVKNQLHHHMATIKKFFLPVVLLIITSINVTAQSSYNNNWIDYSKTYYKFKVGTFGKDYEGQPVRNGVVRIYGNVLAASGLGSIPAEQLQLWRNGQEIPIYVSKAVGTLSAADYIEFWGEAADGKPDKDLYRDPSYQLNDYWSLETDSAAYFFTQNWGDNKRLESTNNDVAGATIKADKNFVHTISKSFREMVNPGFGAATGKERLYSSSYDKGEGLTSQYSGYAVGWAMPKLYLDKDANQPMTLKTIIAGAGLQTRSILIYSKSGGIYDSIGGMSLNFYGTLSKTFPGISNDVVRDDAPEFTLYDMNFYTDGDNIVLSQMQLSYTRKFDMGGASNFEFTLPASDTGRLIKLSNFASNGAVPVLYDIDNGKSYVAVTETGAGLFDFLLQPSTKPYHLALVRGDGSDATNITSIEKRNFTDFSKINNQGNYLIITNPVLMGSEPADNYVEQYRQYRTSAAGGGYIAKVIDITDLEDQFAFGIKRHPLAIKNFLRFARNAGSIKPGFAFLIGKGLDYNAYRLNETDPVVEQTSLVQTFGIPGSDNLLSSNDYDPVPATPIGRLSAISTKEVGDYFAKVKQYEQAQQDPIQTVANKGWMKNVLQLAGVNDATLGVTLEGYLKNYKSIISDSAFGANVTNYSKSGDASDYQREVVNFTQTFNNGSALVMYFGHSSSTNLDFSLDNPANYNNAGRYPMFIVNGCLAGNIFDYSSSRPTTLSTISEKFVLQPQRGAIGYLSTSSFGVVDYLNTFTTEFYNSMSKRQYGKGFGIVVQDAISSALNIRGVSDFYARIHAEQYTFHGDPALRMNTFAKPDYALQSPDVTINPSFISVADDSFNIKVVITNLGKATNNPVHFSLYRKSAAGDSTLVYSRQFASIKIKDSISANIAVVPNRDKGITHFVAHIDDDNSVDELSYDNNVLDIPVTISTADIRPVYPYNYAIVNTASVTLSASTADPIDTVKTYIIETDTTSLFNSPGKASYTITSPGGVIQKTIALPLNNTVYFWRVAAANSNHWNVFSFTHNSAGNAGFEQAHFLQHTQSSFADIEPDSAGRAFNFGKTSSILFVRQAIYGKSGSGSSDFSIAVDGTYIAESACVGHSVVFNVFDPLTFKPVKNTTAPYGAAPSCQVVTPNNFEFSVLTPETRNNAVTFLDKFVKPGQYVIARSMDEPYDSNGDPQFAAQWAKDTALYGHNNSLYNRLKDQGIDIDGYNFNRCYIFMFKKDDSAHFSPVSVYSLGEDDAITFSRNMSVADTIGTVTSPKFGPGKAWSKVIWQGTEVNSNNTTVLNIIGVDKNNQESVLYTIGKDVAAKDISAVSAAAYPYLRLQMRTEDSATVTPYQLKNWAVEYTPVPEGALAANIGSNLPGDTVNIPHAANKQDDMLGGYITFKNVSALSFTPLKVTLQLSDSSGNVYPFPLNRTKALASGDTAKIAYDINLKALPEGKYNFYLMVNGDNDQPEQFLFNNSLYKYIYLNRSAVMPAHLLSFNGQAIGKGVNLTWKATNEINFSYYGVEHSEDGRTFAQIGTVQAQTAAGGNDIKNYSFLHLTPGAKNYYRLKLVDKDGRFGYSNIISVNFGTEAEISVYPNPFITFLTVNAGSAGKNVVRVFDVNGKLVSQQAFTGSTTVLDVSKLAAGSYMVQVNSNDKLQTFKMQKHNN